MKLNTASVFTVTRAPKRLDPELYPVADPQPTQQSNLCIFPDPIEAADTLTHVAQFNQRMLPSSVVKERLDDVIESVTREQGRKPGKKERENLKDGVIHELLPQAFIRRSLVAFTLTPEHLVVWSGSATKVDTILTLLVAAGEGVFDVLPAPALNPIARGEHDTIHPGSTATLKLGDKAIKVKNVAVEGSDVQRLLDEGYDATEVSCVMPVSDTDYSFTVNDAGVIKKLDTGSSGDPEDNGGTVLIALDAVKAIVSALGEEEL